MLPYNLPILMPRRSPLLLLTLSLLAGAGTAGAAVFSVADGDVGGLIGAIADANDEASFPGPDTIVLAANGTYTLTGINNINAGLNGLPSITSHITIQGQGATIRRSTSGGVPGFRLFHLQPSGTLALNDVTLARGRAIESGQGGNGGAVYAAGTLILEGVTIRDGVAQDAGGGVFVFGSVTMTNSTLSGNSAAVGGALAVAVGASSTLLNTTITLNAATTSGGGLYVVSSGASYENTIIAGNVAAVSGSDCSGGGITSAGNNLVGNGTGCPTTGSDLTTSNVANELNTTLADNGGPTETHALVGGSQAIDAGDDGSAPANDQRGVARADGDSNGTVLSDIGAYEYLVPPAVLIVESGGSTDVAEGGATDTYSVRLATQPAADVTISFAPDAQVQASASTLTFTSQDWFTPQTVTVTAVDDAVVEGLHTGTIAHSATSGDPDYNGIGVPSVTAHITDNDVAGVTIAPTTVDLTEAGITDTYGIQLQSQPTSTVSITALVNDGQTQVSSDGNVFSSSITLTFTTQDWFVPKTVFVRAVDDLVVEGPHIGTIAHTISGASEYAALSLPPVTANITDNDSQDDGGFFTVTPCRVLDTRTLQGGPVLASGNVRVLALHGVCGIPASAKAVALAIAATEAAGAGFLTFYPADGPTPSTSSINFVAAQTRSGNAIVGLAGDGSGELALLPTVAGAGTVHVVVDVSGYFE